MADWVFRTPDYDAMIEEIATLRAHAEAAERERDEARAELALLTEERDRLRGALGKAMGDLRVAASYASEPGISVGLRAHARSCADTLRTVSAALAGEASEDGEDAEPECGRKTIGCRAGLCGYCRGTPEKASQP